MKRLVLILCFLLPGYLTYSQAFAGIDIVICDGKEVEIGGTDDSDNCYSWESTPSDPVLTSQAHLAKPKVNPSQTTTYTLTVTGPGFSFRSTDDIKVSVVRIKEILVKEQSEPDAFYDIPEAGGSIFKTGSFTFKVSMESADASSVTLSYDVYDLDFFNEEISKGETTTGNFTIKFSQENSDGNVRVRFWYDKNKNSTPEEDECMVESEFEVKEIKQHSFSIARASTTVPLFEGDVDAILKAGTDLIKVKQEIPDFRCACELRRNGIVSLWNPTSETPDEILTKADFDNINKNVQASIKIVKQIRYCDGPSEPGLSILGCAVVGSANTIVVVDRQNEDVWTHEIGHTMGLQHRPTEATGSPDDFNNLMYPHAIDTQFMINEDECKAFEK